MMSFDVFGKGFLVIAIDKSTYSINELHFPSDHLKILTLASKIDPLDKYTQLLNRSIHFFILTN